MLSAQERTILVDVQDDSYVKDARTEGKVKGEAGQQAEVSEARLGCRFQPHAMIRALTGGGVGSLGRRAAVDAKRQPIAVISSGLQLCSLAREPSQLQEIHQRLFPFLELPLSASTKMLNIPMKFAMKAG